MSFNHLILVLAILAQGATGILGCCTPPPPPPPPPPPKPTTPALPDFILVIGGVQSDDYGTVRIDKVEVASPDPTSSPVRDCWENLGNFPQQISAAVGTTFGQVPHVCGGNQGGSLSDQCWKKVGQTEQWTSAGKMNEARYKSAGAHHPDIGFVITGGEDRGFLSTTEISRDGITFESYTPLPIGLEGHCMVALEGNDGEFFIGGGYSSSGYSNRAFIHKGNEWVEVEQMPTARTDLMCGPVRASPGGRVVKIVAASGFPRTNRVYEYNIATNTWKEGNSFPVQLYRAAVVEHEDSFLILGGYDGSSMSDQLFIYSYKEEREEWEWEEVPTPLSEKRQYLTAINVKATVFQSC